MGRPMSTPVCLVALLLCACLAQGDVFYATKDNSVLGYSSEQLINMGALPNTRIAVNYQHQMLMDWDTDAVKGWMAANPGPGYKFELFIMPRGGWPVPPGNSVHIRTLNCGTDWAEGDGSSWTDFAWSDGTAASIYAYAQAYFTDPDATPGSGDEVLDAVNSIAWQKEDGTPVGNLTGLPYNFQNSLDYVASSDDLGSYVGVVLDDALVNDLLNNPLNRGLRTWKDDYAKETANFREQSGSGPYIEVTVVPEPTTIALLGLGLASLAGVRRRRK